MAYWVEIDTGCNRDNCRSRATHEVRNRYNEPIGKFCKKHAEALVEELNKRGD